MAYPHWVPKGRHIAAVLLTPAALLLLGSYLQAHVPATPSLLSIQGVQTDTIVKKTGGVPSTLDIPSIDLHTSVEQVGLTSNGGMDVPHDVYKAGWFNLGHKPGDIGSAVMAGHLDTLLGRPAAFWNLKDMKVGDDVFVTDEDGNKHMFRVTRKETYEEDKAPLQEIFGNSNGRHLNLITCHGHWSYFSDTYNQRLVVFTDLVE